jgi:hypothetical protein
MSIELPKAIAAYFEADNRDAAAVASSFTPDAVVKDEGNIYNGTAEIESWKTTSSAKYSYTSELVALGEDAGRIVVTNHLVGDFPGSPVDLRYFFTLAGDKIAALEIAL